MLSSSESPVPERISDWFDRQGWRLFPFQTETCYHYLHGRDVLVHAPTGMGKTLSAILGPACEWIKCQFTGDTTENCRNTEEIKLEEINECSFLNQFSDCNAGGEGSRKKRTNQYSRRAAFSSAENRILWVTPMRALSADTERSLQKWAQEFGLPWTVESRTSDTRSSIRASHRKRLPTVLVTTPESLTVLLSYPESNFLFRGLKCVVIDEWHELLGTKRGTQTELALTRLSRIAPQTKRIALSATLGNLEQAAEVLSGIGRQPAVIVRGSEKKEIEIRSILPEVCDRFPWAGHLGLSMLNQVADQIEAGGTTLVFTNTRNQTEQWYHELLRARPQWAGIIALHHGSLDKGVRDWVEEAMREKKLKAVVCTSSLDLGVDYASVDQVIQIGSPKGTARLLQRAGRSGHTPGSVSRCYFVPTHAFELLEIVAAKEIVSNIDTNQEGIESREPVRSPLDCLAQHLITIGCAGPFQRESILDEVKKTYSYSTLLESEFDWVLRFVLHGGDSLSAYTEFHKLMPVDAGYQVANDTIAKKHRMAIGTIASDLSINVQYLNGQKLGMVEESFAGKLKEKDCFHFAGKVLEVVQLREGAVWVRRTNRGANVTPRWQGGRMPLSSKLATQVRDVIDRIARGQLDGDEYMSIHPVVETQRRLSCWPHRDETLVEQFEWRSAHYLCIFPFAGRMVHDGLASLIAYRLMKGRSLTMSLAVNDYGILVQSNDHLPVTDGEFFQELFNRAELLVDMQQSIGLGELAKRQFREIARVSGLIHPGLPGRMTKGRHLQASSNMFYDAFTQYDPDHLLLEQAKREVLSESLEWERLLSTVQSMERNRWRIVCLNRPTPFSFPLIVEQMRQRMSNESLVDRIRKIQSKL